MDTTTRVYFAARLPDGRVIIGALAVLEPLEPEPARVIDLRSAPSRRTLRGEHAEPARAA